MKLGRLKAELQSVLDTLVTLDKALPRNQASGDSFSDRWISHDISEYWSQKY